MTKEEKIKEIENFIQYHGKHGGVDAGTLNASYTEKLGGTEYEAKKKDLDFSYFLSKGDLHYFVARILFIGGGIVPYSFFCTQQCIELYLKGYLQYKKVSFEETHDLHTLLSKCKTVSIEDAFIISQELEIILNRFNAFNEYARYPVTKKRPRNGKYISFFPDDIKIVDYFIYKMREIMPYPKNMHDILKDGKISPLFDPTGFGLQQQKFTELFMYENINFL